MMNLGLTESGIVFRNPYPADWPYHGFHPSLIEVQPGEILCHFRRGACMYSDDGRIVACRSMNYGETWQQEGVLWEDEESPSGYGYTQSGLTRLQNSDLIANLTRFQRPAPDVPYYNEQTGGFLAEENLVSRSSDGGRTWTEPYPILLPDGLLGDFVSPLVELGDGTWMLACDTAKSYYDPAPLTYQMFGVISRDQGMTWGEPIMIADGVKQDINYFHGRFVHRLDGRIFAMLWAQDIQTGKFLHNHLVMGDPIGKHWSEPMSTNVFGQTSRLVDLGEDRVFLVYSFRESESPGIMGALSEDNGRTFDLENQVVLWDAYGKESLGVPRTDQYPSSHDVIAFGAPTAIRLHDGSIMVAYWATQAGLAHVRWARLALKEKHDD